MSLEPSAVMIQKDNEDYHIGIFIFVRKLTNTLSLTSKDRASE
jgi:hypothetical protein